MQLLDELHWKLEALAYEPTLDPRGRRRAALLALIARLEGVERDELQRFASRSARPLRLSRSR